MSLFDDLNRMLNDTVGNNMTNEEEDAFNTKENFARTGRYNEPIENGIIDRELDNAIWGFQRDNDLKQDGYMRPGGETETALQREVKEREDESVKTAGLPLALGAGATTLRALSVISKSLKHNKSKTKNRDKVNESVVVTPDPDDHHDACYESYLRERSKCKQLGLKTNKRAAQNCYASATARLRDCQLGKSENEWPDLKTRF